MEFVKPTSMEPAVTLILTVHEQLMNLRSSIHRVKSVQIRSLFWSVFGHFLHGDRKDIFICKMGQQLIEFKV